MKYIKTLEELKVGYKFNEGVNGSIITDSQFSDLPNIIKFLESEDITYNIFYNPNNFVVIFFPNLHITTNIGMDWNDVEKKKFPEDKWNEYKPYLPVINNDGVEVNGFEIRLLYKDHIENSTEIKDIKDLDIAIQSNKYNL